jgi:hypothetical protein
MADKARHAFGSSSNVESAIQAKKIDAYDILFLDGDTDSPKIGWVDKNGKAVILKDEKADLTELEAEVAKKANAEEVKAEIEESSKDTVATAKAYTDGKVESAVEAAMSEHLVKRYKVEDVPAGTLVDYFDKEISIMCPVDAEFVKQAVGTGGDANTYYMTFKTYAPSDDVVGYIEHLGDVVDSEILTDLKTDEYGRKYQPTWLGLAKYDEATGWAYYGKNSSVEKYIGWNYQIDWYDANGVMVKSDVIRINLSNEDCHNTIEPYYVGSMKKEFDTKIEERIEERIAEVEAAYEVIEF